ncbi:hypothetical protein AB0D14_31845 [Streptomyces sp. NPDC048484]
MGGTLCRVTDLRLAGVPDPVVRLLELIGADAVLEGTGGGERRSLE